MNCITIGGIDLRLEFVKVLRNRLNQTLVSPVYSIMCPESLFQFILRSTEGIYVTPNPENKNPMTVSMLLE